MIVMLERMMWYMRGKPAKETLKDEFKRCVNLKLATQGCSLHQLDDQGYHEAQINGKAPWVRAGRMKDSRKDTDMPKERDLVMRHCHE